MTEVRILIDSMLYGESITGFAEGLKGRGGALVTRIVVGFGFVNGNFGWL